MLKYIYGGIANDLIFPFRESEVGISALCLNDGLSFKVTHAHADLEGRRFARLPEV
jgi:hypothetical protein